MVSLRSDTVVLLRTVHGSKLYGLDHAGSDHDEYVVLAHKGKLRRQTIVGADDTATFDFDSFLAMCHKGVPQALEAMFSRKATVDLLPSFRMGHVAGNQVLRTYRRTVKAFMEEGSFKRRRHALRLILNAEELEATGRFNPTLTPQQVAQITELAQDQDRAEEKIQEWISEREW